MPNTPIEMPFPFPANAKSFDLGYVQDVSPVGSGFIQGIERAPPMWVAQYTTPVLTPARDMLVQAFLDELEGALTPFLAVDLRRPRPFNYLGSSGTPWATGAVLVTNAVYSTSVLTLSGMTAGVVINKGDYISFKRGNAWFLHRSRSTVTCDGTDDIVVSPRPETNGTDVTARLNRACCAMLMLGRPKKTDNVSDVGPSYTFSGVQYIDRST